MALQLLESHAEPLIRKCLVSALQGDLKAMQLCMDRILPARRELPLKVGRLSLGSIPEISKASELVTQRVASGHLTPGQGHALAELIERRRKVLETEDLDRRLQELEGKQ